MDNDILLLNRQPTLHRGSMIAQRIKIRPGKTIRMNLAVTSSYNADFDGDEMNLYAPSSTVAQCELENLSSVDNFIINPQNSSSNIVIVQDSILGVYKMTLEKYQQVIPKTTFMTLLAAFDYPSVSDLYHEKKNILNLIVDDYYSACCCPIIFFIPKIMGLMKNLL